VIGVVLGISAGAFLIVGVAFGLNPARSAAWGAICGAVLSGGFLFYVWVLQHNDGPWNDYVKAGWQSSPVVGAANAPRLVPTDDQPATMNVQGPDGSVVQFPAGTDPATGRPGDA
jgi:hypothetical protein